ncbi:MAG: hypothetical protein AAF533_01675 [Acidobacteriota bacterium]
MLTPRTQVTSAKPPGLFRRLWLRQRARREAQRERQRIAELPSWEKYRLDQDEHGLTWRPQYPHLGEPIRILWRDVEKVEAYKLDLYAFDRVCLLFTTPGFCLEVSEDEAGFEDLTEVLPRRLPDFPSPVGWVHDVMVDPFETNHAVLFDRTIAV